MKVYVAAPWGRAGAADDAHKALRKVGVIPTSRWVDQAREAGPDLPSPQDAARAILMNDTDIAGSDAVLVLSFLGEGGEMFAEARYALVLGLPVVWVGARQILSVWRPGVVLVDGLYEGALLLAGMRGRA